MQFSKLLGQSRIAVSGMLHAQSTALRQANMQKGFVAQYASQAFNAASKTVTPKVHSNLLMRAAAFGSRAGLSQAANSASRQAPKVVSNPVAPSAAAARRAQTTATSWTNPEANVYTDPYPVAMQYMHWAMGIVLLGAVGTVLLAQNTKVPAEKGNYMMIHKSFGLIALCLVGFRIGMRLTQKLPEHIPGSAIEQFAANLSHYGMYALFTFLPVSGAVMGYFGGKGIPFFGLFTVPGADEANKSGKIAGTAFKLHKQAGQIFEYLIPIHIGAVVYHHARGHHILQRVNIFRSS